MGELSGQMIPLHQKSALGPWTIRDFCGFCVGDFLGRYSEEILGDIFVWILWDFGIFKGKVGNIFQHLMMSALSNLPPTKNKSRFFSL